MLLAIDTSTRYAGVALLDDSLLLVQLLHWRSRQNHSVELLPSIDSPGFVDQGESIEEAVAREVMEEAGITVGQVRYHSSQPWPFPHTLMIGCLADAVTTDISFDDEEMADVRWFQRDEVILALDGKSDLLAVPGPIAIAHHIIKAWATGNAP